MRWGKEKKLLLNEYRNSVLRDEKSSGDSGGNDCTIMNILNASEVYTEKLLK